MLIFVSMVMSRQRIYTRRILGSRPQYFHNLPLPPFSPAFTLRHYRAMHYSAKRGLAIVCRLSVCLSVCLYVCPSVTLVDHVHLG